MPQNVPMDEVTTADIEADMRDSHAKKGTTYSADSTGTASIIQQPKPILLALLRYAEEAQMLFQLYGDIRNHLLLPWFGFVLTGLGAV
jgi:hypothetical protein